MSLKSRLVTIIILYYNCQVIHAVYFMWFFYLQTYIFRGAAQGFVEFTSFKTVSPIKQMFHNEIVTHPTQLLCPQHYLVLVFENEIEFTKAVTIGDCKINEKIDC